MANLPRGEDELGRHGCGHAPANDPPCEDIDHEGYIDCPRPGRHISEVRNPQLVGTEGSAKKKWRKLDGQNRLPEIIEGFEFRDGTKHESKAA
jgi:hypothetical protein